MVETLDGNLRPRALGGRNSLHPIRWFVRNQRLAVSGPITCFLLVRTLLAILWGMHRILSSNMQRFAHSTIDKSRPIVSYAIDTF